MNTRIVYKPWSKYGL